MKYSNYETPLIIEQEMFLEGILCMSAVDVNDNESYGGDPTDADSIF